MSDMTAVTQTDPGLRLRGPDRRDPLKLETARRTHPAGPLGPLASFPVPGRDTASTRSGGRIMAGRTASSSSI